jgi:hypothetical protein
MRSPPDREGAPHPGAPSTTTSTTVQGDHAQNSRRGRRPLHLMWLAVWWRLDDLANRLTQWTGKRAAAAVYRELRRHEERTLEGQR